MKFRFLLHHHFFPESHKGRFRHYYKLSLLSAWQFSKLFAWFLNSYNWNVILIVPFYIDLNYFTNRYIFFMHFNFSSMELFIQLWSMKLPINSSYSWKRLTNFEVLPRTFWSIIWIMLIPSFYGIILDTLLGHFLTDFLEELCMTLVWALIVRFLGEHGWNWPLARSEDLVQLQVALQPGS